MSWFSDYRRFLREHGVCPGCKGNVDRKGLYCQACARAKSSRTRAAVVLRVEKGLCAGCGKESRRNKTECGDCAAIRSDRDWLRRRGHGRGKPLSNAARGEE